jgi:hypothetical protein
VSGKTSAQRSCLHRDAARHLGLLGLCERTTPLLEDLVEVVLEPPDIGVEARKLPLAVDLLVPVHVKAVGVALDCHLCPCLVSVSLVRHPQLVVPDHLVLCRLLPSCAANEVLRLEEGVAQHRGVGGHGDKFIGGHGLPNLAQERTVIDPESRRDAFAETVPVLTDVSSWYVVR